MENLAGISRSSHIELSVIGVVHCTVYMYTSVRIYLLYCTYVITYM